MARSRLGRLARGIIGYGLLGLGSLFLLVSFITLFAVNDDSSNTDNAIVVSVIIGGIFGALPFAGGIVILRSGKGAGTETAGQVVPRQSREEILRASFFDLVKENQGQVTLMQFAMAANVSGEAAQQYLQDRAKEFGADFQVNDQGTVIYIFPL